MLCTLAVYMYAPNFEHNFLGEKSVKYGKLNYQI